MKYLLMLFADEQVGLSMPADQMAAAMKTMSAYADALKKAGVHISNAALMPTSDAKTLRMSGGEVKLQDNPAQVFVNEGGDLQVHDGPYADTREQLGGYYIIDVPDLQAALDWAARCPAAQWGSIEIRPFREDV
ncbi:MAG: hypothetical protein JWR75_1273 [Devosia sp.]|nr:hypothetical protein [Devosia sp.]